MGHTVAYTMYELLSVRAYISKVKIKWGFVFVIIFDEITGTFSLYNIIYLILEKVEAEPQAFVVGSYQHPMLMVHIRLA